jgi:hypothetical protein
MNPQHYLMKERDPIPDEDTVGMIGNGEGAVSSRKVRDIVDSRGVA